MNKNLTAAAILLVAGYLAYNTYSESDKVDFDAIAESKTVKITKDSDKSNEVLEEYDTEQDVLNGEYLTSSMTKIADTSQKYTFQSDYSFEIVRTITVPDSDSQSFSVSGTYKINNSKVTLNLGKERHPKFFPHKIMKLKLLKDGNLRYEKLLLEKQ